MRALKDDIQLDLGDENVWMWAWVFAAMLSTGIVAGSIFAVDGLNEWGEPARLFHWGAFFIGALAGGVGAIPVMVGFRVAGGIMVNLGLQARYSKRIARAIEDDDVPAPAASAADTDGGDLPRV
ncbi:hypothetical protein [Demequina soli]|uniref:hypothetical protein n=1 Tax=Demequina soli TaxID=1638987 RepID=UPI0007803502|nr:hypothetical protein [Demequina soli]